MPKPLLTIILPNRGRSKYLNVTLSNLSDVSDPRVEILFLDNSQLDGEDIPLLNLINNIRVESSAIKLSMTKNWFRGLDLAQGEWITFIGSDDGIVADNIPVFLDFLENVTKNVVSTHPIYFQYPILGKASWADLPSSNLQIWSKGIRYVSLLAVLFPQFKLDLPVPYNRCVVRASVLKNYSKNYDDIIGVSPDDFLGQYVSQESKVGTYIELPVFIHGGSERSNGFQLGRGNENLDSGDFLSDSHLKFESVLKKYGIFCSFALAFENYSKARISRGKALPTFYNLLIIIWAEIFCRGVEHHKNNCLLNWTRRIAHPTHQMSYRMIRKFWLIFNFGKKLPVKNQKNIQDSEMDVLQLSRTLAVK
jgi:glycosyltransferase involved in cell wall biosynthesis